jgi:hypothetical protein
MSFDDVSLKIVCGFMTKPGKVQSDGRSGLQKPGFGLTQDDYLKRLHGYLYQNPASRYRHGRQPDGKNLLSV